MSAGNIESGGGWRRWIEHCRLWVSEIRLRFDLQYSKSFKKLCEKRGCRNLASLEEGYIHQVQEKIADLRQRRTALRACLKIQKSAAARDFGRGQGGEAGASPQRPVTDEPTRATGKRPAAAPFRIFRQALKEMAREKNTTKENVAVRPNENGVFSSNNNPEHNRTKQKNAL